LIGKVLYLVDSNVLLYLVNQDSQEHAVVAQCLELLWERGNDLTYTSQNLAEFWNVCTRPADRNGFWPLLVETNKRALLVETRLRLAEDSVAVHREWRTLIVDLGVSGVQVHDARLVAAMRVHQIRTIITYNLRDFRRFAGVTAILPHDILRGSEG
jgi:predicted nucleic acid-binding protein